MDRQQSLSARQVPSRSTFADEVFRGKQSRSWATQRSSDWVLQYGHCRCPSNRGCDEPSRRQGRPARGRRTLRQPGVVAALHWHQAPPCSQSTNTIDTVTLTTSRCNISTNNYNIFVTIKTREKLLSTKTDTQTERADILEDERYWERTARYWLTTVWLYIKLHLSIVISMILS